jgi:transposase
VTIAYLMLKNNEPYRYAQPELMRKKFAKLQHPDPSRAEDSPAPGRRAKAGAGLMDVYRAAGLPPVTPPEELPAGERRMLEERELADFLQGVYRTPGPDAEVHPAASRRKARSRASTSPQSPGRPPGRPS